MLDQHEQIQAGIKGYEARKAEIETAIKFRMREAERIVGLPGWNITWKTQHRNEYTVPAKDIRTLQNSSS